MSVDHTTLIAHSMASPATIEHIDTYEENIDEYKEKNYTYIPLPLDRKYFDRENNKLRELDAKQFIKVDSTIRQVIEHLRNHPFLLIKHNHNICKTDDGELVVDDFLMQEEWTSLGIAEEVVKELPEYRDKIIQLCESKPIFEIVTLADVNRRVVKETLYSVLAELENRFVLEIKSSRYEPKELYSDLSARTVGRWEKAKLRNVEMHIAEYMTLSEMMKVVGKNEPLRKEFGYSSRNQFDNDLGGLVDLRNKIMHASRTLVNDRSDLDKLIERVNRAETAIERHGGKVVRGVYDKPYWE